MRVVVILGAAVWPGGTPSPTLRRRTAAAAAIWSEGDVDLVIPSGGVGRNPPAEAEVMRRLLREAGVPADTIRPEEASATTMETARNVSAMLPADARIVAVTDGYHSARSWLAFRAHGRRIGTRSAAFAEPRPRRGVALRAWARESIAFPAYVIRIALGRI